MVGTKKKVGKTRRNKVILAVDDDPISRHFVKFILEMELKLNIILASDGAEALKILKSERVDLIITDLNMPHMNGLELLRLVKRNYPRLKIVVISSDFKSFSITKKELFNQGAHAAIPKEKMASLLPATVKKLMGFFKGIVD